jgi:hypothetical protein
LDFEILGEKLIFSGIFDPSIFSALIFFQKHFCLGNLMLLSTNIIFMFLPNFWFGRFTAKTKLFFRFFDFFRIFLKIFENLILEPYLASHFE